jgi:hypothetical protein
VQRASHYVLGDRNAVNKKNFWGKTRQFAPASTPVCASANQKNAPNNAASGGLKVKLGRDLWQQ